MYTLSRFHLVCKPRSLETSTSLATINSTDIGDIGILLLFSDVFHKINNPLHDNSLESVYRLHCADKNKEKLAKQIITKSNYDVTLVLACNNSVTLAIQETVIMRYYKLWKEHVFLILVVFTVNLLVFCGMGYW